MRGQGLGLSTIFRIVGEKVERLLQVGLDLFYMQTWK